MKNKPNQIKPQLLELSGELEITIYEQKNGSETTFGESKVVVTVDDKQSQCVILPPERTRLLLEIINYKELIGN
jgi:hypothetical protein